MCKKNLPELDMTAIINSTLKTIITSIFIHHINKIELVDNKWKVQVDCLFWNEHPGECVHPIINVGFSGIEEAKALICSIKKTDTEGSRG